MKCILINTVYTFWGNPVIHWGWYIQENHQQLPRYWGKLKAITKQSTSICVHSSHTQENSKRLARSFSKLHWALLGLPNPAWKRVAPVLAAPGSPFRKRVLSWSSAVPRAPSKAGRAKAETVPTVGNFQQQPVGATDCSLEQPLQGRFKQPIIQLI